MHLKSINRKTIRTTIKFAVVMPFALIGRLWAGDVWIITERPDQACDNGYVFFRYLKEKKPGQKAYYVIDKAASDYAKINRYGSVIQFDSWAHYYYYCLSRIHISAHLGGCVPSSAPVVKYFKNAIGIKDVLIPHGVSYGVSEFCLKKYARINLFICSGKPEYENVLKNYGYDASEVAYTGFPRLDQWHDITINKRQLLLMPTWRMYIAQHPEVDIYKTDYYKQYQSLINNRELHHFLEEYDLQFVFYLHHNMQKYANAFSAPCSRIKIVQEGEQCDIQELLKSSAILITDYSSVHFDFAYMGKPVIYYQFDKETFFSRQYKVASFDAEKDGFGKVIYHEDELVNQIKETYFSGAALEGRYLQNMRKFYQLYDRNNCDRVYKAIKSM